MHFRFVITICTWASLRVCFSLLPHAFFLNLGKCDALCLCTALALTCVCVCVLCVLCTHLLKCVCVKSRKDAEWVCVSIFAPWKLESECLRVLDSSSAPLDKCLLVCVRVCACAAAAQDVSPVLFMLDWLTYRVPQSWSHDCASQSHGTLQQSSTDEAPCCLLLGLPECVCLS